MFDNSEFPGDIIYNGFIPNFKFPSFVYLFAVNYDENNNCIKCYHVSIMIHNQKRDLYDDIKEFLNGDYSSIGWDPYSGIKGVIKISNLIDGFENVQKYIDKINMIPDTF